MSVLVDDQLGRYGRPGRLPGQLGELRRPTTARRNSGDALRRPPRGARVVTQRPAGPVAACARPRSSRRWRALLVTAAAVCAVVFGFGAVVGSLANGLATEVPKQTAVVSVAPGESLWDVATRYAPGSDPRAIVQRIEELNGVSADAVTAGSALTVPVQSAG